MYGSRLQGNVQHVEKTYATVGFRQMRLCVWIPGNLEMTNSMQID